MVKEKNLLDSLGRISESIEMLIRFMEALTKFVGLHKLGIMSFELLSQPELYEKRGYDIAAFTLEDANGNDVMYLNIYTNGTVTGENFTRSGSDSGIDCPWNEALQEILKTLGVLNHSALIQEKVGKAIDILGH